MSPSTNLTLFDIPANLKDRKQARSHCTWRSRFALNYKRLPYTSSWVEYPDIASTFKEAGIPPSNSLDTPYAAPAIIDTSHSPATKLLESFDISKYLDETYPARPLYRGTPESIAAQEYLVKMYNDKRGPRFWHLIVPSLITKLHPSSAAYFRRTREAKVNCTLESLTEPALVEVQWTKVAADVEWWQMGLALV